VSRGDGQRPLRHALDAQLADIIPPNSLLDTDLIRSYRAVGEPNGSLIPLALGEDWRGPPELLRRFLEEAHEDWTHGYQLSMWGEPAYRLSAREHAIAQQELEPFVQSGNELEFAAVWSGTRGAIFDFARLLDSGASKTQAAIFASPGYDYGAIFAAAGFAPYPAKLEPKNLAMNGSAFAEAAARAEAHGHRPAVFVLNPQHNPSAREWEEEVVCDILKQALQRSAAILIDNAHFGVCGPLAKRTSAMRCLLAMLGGSVSPVPWLAVQSLGKQFNCNGWGLGIMAGSRSTLRTIVEIIRPQREYNLNAAAQRAMGRFLRTSHSSEALNDRNTLISRNRAGLGAFLTQRGLCPDFFPDQVCTTFSVFPLPYNYRRPDVGPAAFIKDALRETGILLGAMTLSPTPTSNASHPYPFIRIHLGLDTKILEVALSRLDHWGLSELMERK